MLKRRLFDALFGSIRNLANFNKSLNMAKGRCSCGMLTKPSLCIRAKVDNISMWVLCLLVLTCWAMQEPRIVGQARV